MKKFKLSKLKFTFATLFILILLFLSMYKDVANPSKITVNSVSRTERFVTIGGKVSRPSKFDGYTYENKYGVCYVKVYSSLALFGGENEFEIRVGDCEKIYITDGKNNKEVILNEQTQ